MAVSEQQFITKLAALFPTCFTEDWTNPHRPLKVGIYDDVLALGVLTEDEVKAALAMYTRRTMYQRALAAGGVRVDLDGNAAGEVTAEQIETAKQRVANMEKKRARKAKAAADRRADKAAEKPAAQLPTRAANDTAATPAPDPAPTKRLGLAELRAAALARRAQVQA